MKTKIILSVLLFCGLIGWNGPSFASPDGDDFFTVTGVVKDARTNRTLANVNVVIPGTGIGTVSNADGGFSIKIRKTLRARQLEFTHLGYVNQRLNIPEGNLEGVTVSLIGDVMTMEEVVVRSADPKELVRTAIGKIEDNYSSSSERLTGFYRETIRKRERYITISEAVLNVYKTPYSENIDRERIVVEKGRQLLSPRRADTLMVKLQGGPYLPTYVDIVKNPNLMLSEEDLDLYQFSMEQPAMINDRPHYVVSFIPQIATPYPLLAGELFIDCETLGFARAQMRLDMRDPVKATQVILRKKPLSLRFRPEELSYLVTYREQDGRYVLNYVRSQIRFKCDWRRRLFSTNYTVVSETVITDRMTDPQRVAAREVFRPSLSLSDEVSHFYDENFWEDYNIIEPTESLEDAVDRLKKQHR